MFLDYQIASGDKGGLAWPICATKQFNVLKQSSCEHSEHLSALLIFHNENEAVRHSRRALEE